MMPFVKTAAPFWQGLAFLALLAVPGCAETPASGLRLVVLGTAQDGGFPHAACRCVRCKAASTDPSEARRIAALGIVDRTTGTRVLVDAGPDIREQLAVLNAGWPDRSGGTDRSPVDGVLLTHAHLGHYTGLAFFGFEAVHTRELPVWCTGPMAGYLRINGPWSQLVEYGNVHLREIEPGRPFSPMAGVQVTAVQVPHRDEYADTVAYLIRGERNTVFYVPDTDRWDLWATPLTEILRDVDVALLDGSFFSPDELPGRSLEDIPHPLIPTTMDLLQGMVDQGGLEVWFTHLNHSNPVLGPNPAPRREVERRGFRIADDGLEIPL